MVLGNTKHAISLHFLQLTPTSLISSYALANSGHIFSRRYSPSIGARNGTSPEILHARLIKEGSYGSAFLLNHLLDGYARSSSFFHHAHKLFDEIPDRNVRTWTLLISGYARKGCFGDALGLFRRMQREDAYPNRFTLAIVLKCCAGLCEVKSGKTVHGWVLRSGVGLDAVLENAILDVYVKFGAVDYAGKWFELMKERDSVSWNVMIGGYLGVGEVGRAVDAFESLDFKETASWNTMIDGLGRNGFETMALDMLYRMAKEGTEFNGVTFSIALNLASCLSVLELGKQIHAHVMKTADCNDMFVLNSLLDMYCKCRKMNKALAVFTNMRLNANLYDPVAEAVSWSSIASGYVRDGEYDRAVQLLRSMILGKVDVDKFTLTSILSACADVGILDLGQQIHAFIQKTGHKLDAYMCSSLIDMYAKCGCLDGARKIFQQHGILNVVLWTSMICGCAFNGQGREALQLFDAMMNKKIRPTEITFVGVLTACSHAGMVEEGLKCFQLMQKVYGIKPGVDHYNCMVDIYGRAGHLNEAKNFIVENGISHLVTVWKSLLTYCRLNKNVELGKWVSERLVRLEPIDAGSSILLSNMCATNRSWETAADFRSLIPGRNIDKIPGQSWIHLKDQVDTSVTGNRKQPQKSILTHEDDFR